MIHPCIIQKTNTGYRRPAGRQAGAMAGGAGRSCPVAARFSLFSGFFEVFP